MTRITSGGFSARDKLTQSLIEAINQHVLIEGRYFRIQTGIEHRFGDEAETVHKKLYNSLGPTTDLLRYFPDSLYFDRLIRLPTWSLDQEPEELEEPADEDITGLFTFFAEFKYTATERPRMIGDVPTTYIGQIERESWLTYKRLTSRNPFLDIYLDGLRTRIVLFYAAPFAPDRLYAGWEENIEPIAVRGDIAEPGKRAVQTRGSGTPWINFDIRQLKPLERFLAEDLFWKTRAAQRAMRNCKKTLFNEG